MTVEISKLTAFAVTGAPTGVTVSKLVAYVLLQPGVEVGATPPVHHMDTYGQAFERPNPVNVRPPV